MVRCFSFLCITALLLAGCATINLSNPAQLLHAPAAQAAEGTADANCAVTPTVMDQPPDDPHADPFGYGNWQVNADRTIWVDIPPSGIWHTGGEKVLWIRPAGTQLKISGQRLDAEAEPLLAEIPCCYPTGFQVTGLHFPTGGCWEVVATAGQHELRFVIEVKDDYGRTWEAPAQRGIDPASPLAAGVLLQTCGADRCELHLLNTETGAPFENIAPLDLGDYSAYGPSSNLTQLALITYRENSTLQDGILKLVDLATWEVVTTTLTFDGVYSPPLFTANNTRLLVVTQQENAPEPSIVHLVDLTNGTLLAEQPLSFYPENYQFTPDGRAIMFYGTAGTTNQPYVALLDADNLNVLWEVPVEGLASGHVMPEGSSNAMDAIWWQPAPVFAPDKALLYIVHADQEKLTSVDFAAQSITTETLSEPLSWIERLLLLTARTAHAKVANGVFKQAMISPDGTQLYVTGVRHSIPNGWPQLQTALGLQVIDLATGEISAQVDTAAQAITIEPEGGRLFLHGWSADQGEPYTDEWTEVLDAATLEQIAMLEGRAISVAHRLDGAPVLLSTTRLDNGKTEFAVLDPQSFEVISATADWYNGYAGWVVLR